MMAAATVFAASCSDFDDYNEAYVTGNAESKLSLWENISGNPELSQFSELLKKGGYDEVLNSPRFYTVWAPKNGTISDYSSLMAMSKDSLVDRFIKNHIANYNYNISETGERRVYTLNDKSMILDNGTYAGLTIDPKFKNVPSVNGILHVIDGYAEYHPNLYEYIFEAGVDSLSKYFKHFQYDYFDAAKSVIGPIDSLGRQTYSDSVIVKRNRLTYNGGLINAELANEDSTYTLLIPTDEAYKNAYETVKKYYRYPSSNEIKYKPITSEGVGKEQVVQVKSDTQTDSIARIQIARTLVFSHGNTYNSSLSENDVLEGSYQDKGDTLCSSYNYYLSNGMDFIKKHTVGEVRTQSNGYARLIDSLAVYSWDVWCPGVSVDLFGQKASQEVYPFSASCQPPTIKRIDNNYRAEYWPYERYLSLEPIGNNSKPEIYFNMSGIRAASYGVYIILLPDSLNRESSENKVTQFDVDISYMGEDGKIKSWGFTKLKAFEGDAKNKINIVKVQNPKGVSTDADKTITFPYAYVSTTAKPYLHMKINRNNYSSTEKNYSQTLRIAGIILVPVEYEEYLTNKE